MKAKTVELFGEELECTLQKQLKQIRSCFLSKTAPLFEKEGCCKCHRKPVKWIDLASATRHNIEVHGYQPGISLEPVKAPWHDALKYNNDQSTKFFSSLQHLQALKENMPITKKLSSTKFTNNKRSVKNIFVELLCEDVTLKQTQPICSECKNCNHVVKRHNQQTSFWSLHN